MSFWMVLNHFLANHVNNINQTSSEVRQNEYKAGSNQLWMFMNGPIRFKIISKIEFEDL